MLKLKINFLFIIILTVLTGCFQDDIPVIPHETGDAVTNSVEIGFDYGNQIYFDLGTDSVAKSNRFMEWDLEFDCRPDSFIVYLNSAKIMGAIPVEVNSLEQVTDTTGLEFDEDHPGGGVTDSSAIGYWWTKNGNDIDAKERVYVVNRGVDEIGREQGFYKIQFLDFRDDKYTLIFSKLNRTSKFDTIQIEKDPEYNFVQLSFNKGGEVLNLQPPKGDWDLLFTRYTELFDVEGFEVYSVTGVWLNQRFTSAAIDTTKDFSELTLDFAQTLEYSSVRDIIGYGWKLFLLEQDQYVIFPEINYIIIDNAGFYYKLHFVDFYDDKGERGYPKFEFQKL